MNLRRVGIVLSVAIGASAVIAAGRAPRDEQDFNLKPCPNGPGGTTAECGTLAVFENRSTRKGRRIDIHFMVLRAEQPHAREALFMFAGGPGEGSTSMTPTANGFARPVRATEDIVLVDQRGTGQSHPLSCGANTAANPAAAFGHVFDPAMVRRCRAALEADADLTQYTTDIAIEDVEDVRARLGYDRISVYGGSYGTRMAQTYLRRHPDRVRSVVIDGVVPFDVAIPLTYAKSAQQSLDRVFAACAANTACHAAHPAAREEFAAILRRLQAGPVAATIRRAGEQVTVKMSTGDFAYAVRGMLYNAQAGLRLPDVIGRATASGDLSEFAESYYARQASLDRAVAYGQHLSVLCAEDVPFPSDREIADATAGTFMGRYLFDEYRSACALWPRATIRPDARTPVTARAPVLLVSGYFDPVTPPEFADRIARSLPLSRLVLSPMTGHGSAGGCARPAVLHVLTTGTFDGMPDVCK